MNGLMSRYRESLKNTPECITLKQCPQIKMDLSGLLKYAKEKGVQPIELSDKETEKFMINK